MAKVLLVEDDQNLREIFEMRLKAEGYETVVAGDGEEALTVAVKEKPDLIIADVMMPRLSGFEMLETLRAAPDMAATKVVMMTALGQAEDQARGEKLGVVKYLVKSQVTLEDFVRVVREVLQPDQKPSQQPDSSINNKKESENSMPDDSNAPTNPAPDAPAGPMPDANPISGAPAMPDAPADSGQMSTAQEQSAVNNQMSDFASSAPVTPPADTGAPAAEPDEPAAPADTGSVPVSPPPAADEPAAPAGGDSGTPPAPADSGSGL
ncbi:MAG TPA: response regulator [Candidatus Nitrosopolaris sp.]|nr:response regulator [Candidatus Nitrosopolaris sp.]